MSADSVVCFPKTWLNLLFVSRDTALPASPLPQLLASCTLTGKITDDVEGEYQENNDDDDDAGDKDEDEEIMQFLLWDNKSKIVF